MTRPFARLARVLFAFALESGTLTAGAMIGPATAVPTIVFDGTPATAAPPTTLGPYTMTPFAADATALGASVDGVDGPTGRVGFSSNLTHSRVGSGWATWSHGYTGDVYWSLTNTSLTLTLPARTGAFYFYAEPNQYAEFVITATTQDGTTSGPVTVNGYAGATYYGFYATGGAPLETITVSSTSAFAVGEFGIAQELYDFSGFDSPVNNLPTINAVKAGQAVPVKFSLGGDEGLDVLAVGYPKSQAVACESGAPVDLIESTTTAGGSSLSYDALTDQYSYIWKTEKAWAGTCRELVLLFDDGTEARAQFSLK